MSQLTRGPLPARVYWRRRVVLVVLAVLLVVGLVRLLGGVVGGGDGGGATATPVAGTPTATVTATPDVSPTADAAGAAGDAEETRKARRPKGKPTREALPEPSGRCAPEDVEARPEVASAVAGRAVSVVLRLRTRLSPACTWELGRGSFTWKITSGSDEIWTSRECPRAVPTQELVLRRETVTELVLSWHGRRSDADCSRTTQWAMPGWYHVTVSALGGEPHDRQFELAAPEPVTVTQAPEPDQQDGQREGRRDREGRRGR